MGVDARMLVKVSRPITDDQLKRLRYDLVEAFGTDPFFIIRPGERDWRPDGLHALNRVDGDYHQDGPPISPRNGETMLQVSLSGCYYGVGYERGDLPTIIMIAEWLEARIPYASIYYGDSSGVCAEPFDRVARAQLFDHFALHGHKPYVGDPEQPPSGLEAISDDHIRNPICTFCERRMIRFGWGNNYASFTCRGCGYQQITRDGGETWIDKDDTRSR